VYHRTRSVLAPSLAPLLRGERPRPLFSPFFFFVLFLAKISSPQLRAFYDHLITLSSISPRPYAGLINKYSIRQLTLLSLAFHYSPLFRSKSPPGCHRGTTETPS